MRRMGGSILFVLVVLALAPAAAQASRYCGSVTFEPNTDYTDNNIRATGVSCPKAIDIAVRVTIEGSRVRPFGFKCTGHVSNQGLTHSNVRCTHGSRVVTFISY